MPAGYAHGGLESIPGTETNSPTLSTKVLYPPAISIGVKLGEAPMERDDEIRALNEPIPALSEKYDPSYEWESRGYPDVLGFALSSMFGRPTSTAGNGVITDPAAVAIPVGATRHVWDSSIRGAGGFDPAGAAPQTSQWQLAYADASTATYFKAKGAAVEKMTIESPDGGGMRIKLNGPALFLDRISSPGLTPAFESLAIRPFMRSHLTLPTWLTGTAVHENFGVEISNGVEASHSMGIASKFPDLMERAEGPVIVTGSLDQRQLDPEDYDALKACTLFTALAQWVSESIIASAYPYKLFIQFNSAQYMSGDLDPLMNKRRHGAKFNFKGAVETPGTAAVKITLVNATANYT